MQEGIFSLMQNGENERGLGRLAAAGLPFISILTDPTMGGVTASFCDFGRRDHRRAGASIGFAGARSFGNHKQALPPGFQSAEFCSSTGSSTRSSAGSRCATGCATSCSAVREKEAGRGKSG